MLLDRRADLSHDAVCSGEGLNAAATHGVASRRRREQSAPALPREHGAGTLSDGTTSAIYRLAGATWFGGNFSIVNGKYEFSDTEFFNILAPSGGVVAKVAGVEHMGSGGSNFSFTFGQCQAPQN